MRGFSAGLMFAHQVGRGLEALFTRHKLTFGLEEIDKAFGTELLC